MNLIDELVRRQGGEPDEQFARRLGITRMAWRFLRTHKHRPGRKALAGIVTAYPDLKRSVSDFLVSENDSQATSTDSATTSEVAQ